MCLMSIVTASVALGATTGLSPTRASAQNCAADGAVISVYGYTYAPFDDSSATGSLAQVNPWRFSSEYADWDDWRKNNGKSETDEELW